MATPSSQTITSETKMVPELRPIMPTDIFNAAIQGNSDVLIQRLGLQQEQQTEISVTIDASDSTPEQINTEHQTVQYELQSATQFGNTVLHLLVTDMHNELALKVFERDMSLLKAQNKMLETPLYCAAKVGNNEVIKKLIRINSAVVKDALNETNQHGDTAMHVAVNNDCVHVGRELMMLDPKVAYKVNNKMLTPFYMAIVKKSTSTALTMLDIDRTLASTQFSDGTFPVHIAASLGNIVLLEHLIRVYPGYAELLDPRGRNFFHFAAEQDQGVIIRDVFEITSVAEIARMYDARDYEGNTPRDIAMMKGNKSFCRSVICLRTTIQNSRNLRPENLSRRLQQLIMVESQTFDGEDENLGEKIQVIGLGSALITTVAFAASFTVPGGYNQDNGTPVLGRRYMFWAFILANAFAFIQRFISLFALLLYAILPMVPIVVKFAATFFLLAASSMVVAFGLGMYVTLVPLCFPIAILLVVISLFLATPALLLFLGSYRLRYNIPRVVRILDHNWTVMAAYMVPLVLIFGLALMSL